MRIVQVLNSLAIGGAERMALDLAIAQLSAGHEPHLYCIAGEGELVAEARAAGIPVTNFGKGPGVSLRTVVAMVRSLVRDKPHVVHTHNPPAHYYGALAAVIARVPVVVNTRHSPVSPRGSEYRERYFRWLLPVTDQVVFVSKNVREAIEGEWRPAQGLARVIPNGIPVSKFQLHAAQPGSSRPRTVFGTVGRLVPVKGHQVLIRAFSRVLDEAPEAELRIVGDGPLAEVLRKQAFQLGVTDRVHIEPKTSNVADVLSGLDVFVLSSLSEGLPLVILEAMAAGLPIVSTRVGGIPEVVPEGKIGWFCPPGDAEGLAQAMIAAHQSLDLARRGRAAAELAVAEYDVERMETRYEQLFAELLSLPRC